MIDPIERILAAQRGPAILVPLGASAPATPEEGYALQRRVAERLGESPPAGFKIGATTAQMQRYLGLPSPAAGFTPAAGLHRGHGEFDLAASVEAGVECEVGLRLGRDLPFGRHERAVLAGAVAEVFAAIEVVDRRYGDLAALGTPTLVADSVFHRGGVLGDPAPGWDAGRLAGPDLAAVRGRLEVDGELRGEGVGADLLGHPLEALGWLAASGAASAFGGLRAGQVVLLGSVTPPIWLAGPCAVRVEFSGLGAASARFR